MKLTKTLFVSLMWLLVASGCASYRAVPDGYKGPTARLLDWGVQESTGKGRLLYVVAVDGNKIDNARTETLRASYGRGFNLSLREAGREVKAERQRFTLVGTHVTAAPIHEFASRAIGEFFTVEGDVDFTPQAGKTYQVVGELTKAAAAVWIEDADTKQPVTAKIVAK